DAWETAYEIEERVWAKDLIEEVAQLAGAMYQAMRGVSRRVEDASPQEVKEVTMGGDLARLLPSEHAQVVSPVEAISALASLRILQAKALQLRVAGDRPTGRG